MFHGNSNASLLPLNAYGTERSSYGRRFVIACLILCIHVGTDVIDVTEKSRKWKTDFICSVHEFIHFTTCTVTPLHCLISFRNSHTLTRRPNVLQWSFGLPGLERSRHCLLRTRVRSVRWHRVRHQRPTRLRQHRLLHQRCAE